MRRNTLSSHGHARQDEGVTVVGSVVGKDHVAADPRTNVTDRRCRGQEGLAEVVGEKSGRVTQEGYIGRRKKV